MPPIPIAASILIAPVEIPAIRTCGVSAPILMMEPLPHVFSIWVMARLSALRRSSEILVGWVGCSAMMDLDMGGEPPWLRPEYIPKPLSPPSRTEGVLDVLYLIVHQSDTVKTIDIRFSPEAIHPNARHLHDFSPLGPRHRLQGTSERQPASRLYL